jgi:hypothetical protein
MRTRFIYFRWFHFQMYGGEENLALIKKRHTPSTAKHQDIVDAFHRGSSIPSETVLGAVSPEEHGRGGAGSAGSKRQQPESRKGTPMGRATPRGANVEEGKRLRATGGSMEGAAETHGQQVCSSFMSLFFPSVAGMNKTSAVTDKVGGSSTAAAEGSGPVPHKIRRRVSTVTESEPPQDVMMEEEHSESSSGADEDDANDPSGFTRVRRGCALTSTTRPRPHHYGVTGPCQRARNSRIGPSSSTYCASALSEVT